VGPPIGGVWRASDAALTVTPYMRYISDTCKMSKKDVRKKERELILLVQTLDDFMQIKVKALGHRKKLLNRLSRRTTLNCFIIFYHGLKLTAELLGT